MSQSDDEGRERARGAREGGRASAPKRRPVDGSRGEAGNREGNGRERAGSNDRRRSAPHSGAGRDRQQAQRSGRRDGQGRPERRDGGRRPERRGDRGAQGRRGRPSRGYGDRPERNAQASQDRRGSGPRKTDSGRAPYRGGAGASGGRRDGRDARPSRQERPERPEEPTIAEDVVPAMLDRGARTRLRTLGKNNAEVVAGHLVMAGRLLDEDPELAYEHAHAALRRAGRVDVVREAVALTAYAIGAYAEALRELRTVRRLSGIDAHRALEADCERGLGRPERALAIVSETDPATLTEADRAELAIVASGARSDLGELEAGLLVLESPLVAPVRAPELLRRLALVRADRLEELGRTDEAAAERAAAHSEEDEPEIVVLDLGIDDDDAPEPPSAETDAAEPTHVREPVDEAEGSGSAEKNRSADGETGPEPTTDESGSDKP